MTRGHVVNERLIQTLTYDYTSARGSGSAPRSSGRGSPSAAACGLEAGASLGPMTAAKAHGGDILRASSGLNQLPKPKDRLRMFLSRLFASHGYPKPQEEGSKKMAQEGPERGNPWGASGARAGQGLRVFFVDESARRSERPAVRAAERQSAVQKAWAHYRLSKSEDSISHPPARGRPRGCRQRQAQRLAPKTQAPASRRARGSVRRRRRPRQHPSGGGADRRLEPTWPQVYLWRAHGSKRAV